MSIDPAAPALFKAAQYLRMSTENQRYSLGAQAEAIADYARTRGLEVVRTYADAGKSGLSLKGREGLRALLADVASGGAEFTDILVLDVSRWGRFQDPDEAGHYEYLCRAAGLRVHYCAEEFGDADSIAGSIVKHVKRVMAREYVRELSARIKFAKRRRALMGHRVGGCVGFGLRRQATHHSGAARAVMEAGERKAITSDHTSVVHGPPEEIATVKRIFQLYVRRKVGIAQIARRLNAEGCPGPGGMRWTRNRVRSVLAYEPYTGQIFYGKSTQFLKADVRPVPREHWIRSQTLEPIISRATFRRAAAMLDDIPAHLNDEEVIAGLRRLLAEKGRLTMRLIDECRYLPAATTLLKRFGGRAGEIYARVDYAAPPRTPIQVRTSRRADLVERLRAIHAQHGYVSAAMIEADPTLPSAHTVAANFGSLGNAYLAAGLPYRPRTLEARAPDQRFSKARPRRKIPIIRNDDGSPFTDAQLVVGLRALLSRHGFLSEQLIAEQPDLPTASFYRLRFGSLLEAYAAAGYTAERGALLKETFARRPMRGTWRAQAAASGQLRTGSLEATDAAGRAAHPGA